MKSLPIGIQTFAKIREGGFVYIDKTPHIAQLTQHAGAYFLSRPRRFGKSLLLDTLKELFEGNQTLFADLYIHDKWDWSQTYPVIKLDFAGGAMQTADEMMENLNSILLLNQQRLGVSCTQKGSYGFRELIVKVSQKYQQKVVVLVDEYDKPILDNIDRPEVAAQIREILKPLYSILKEQDRYLQFVFMTGVSKFSKVSLFSGLNQLKDITLFKDYATVCGYTQHDLETTFAAHLAGVDWHKLKEWYNGYQFLGEPVYNPFDILLFISNHQTYRNYWFETGSPSFLLKLFRQQCYFLPDLEKIQVGEEILDSFDVENINPVTLLFQAGYLTIDKAEHDELEELNFHLRTPNREVKSALHNQLLGAYSQQAESLRNYRRNLLNALKARDFDKVQAEVTSLFASIPWRNFTNNDLDSSEGYYASVLYAWLASLNAEVIPEDVSHHGQVDLTIKLADQIYIIEIKLDKTAEYKTQAPNPALQQIKDKSYAQKYQGQPCHLIGMIFNQSARNLVQMNWETI